MVRILRATLLKAAIMATGVLALPAGVSAADDQARCRQPAKGTPGAVARPEQAKARLFERSAEPASASQPGVTQVTGKLAMDALAAPARLARWIKARTTSDAETSN